MVRGRRGGPRPPDHGSDHGSNHALDPTIVMPVLQGGELLGFGANSARHVDTGAATPGLIGDVPDVFAGGMPLAGVKLPQGRTDLGVDGAVSPFLV